MAPPKPPSRWSKPPTGKAPAPKPAAPNPVPVARMPVPRTGPRRVWPWAVLGLVVVVGGLVTLGINVASGIDQPPGVDAVIDANHTVKWDDRKPETVDGLISIDSGRPALTLHFAAGGSDVVFRLTGRLAEQLKERLAKTSALDESLIKLRYLERIYPRVEDRLRMAWQIASRDDLAEGADRVPIRCASRLYAQLELLVPPVDCRDAEHRGTVKPCDRVREAWVARILIADELQ